MYAINGVGHVAAAACTAIDGELQIAMSTEDGRMWGTMRYEDGSWQTPVDDVSGYLGGSSVRVVAVSLSS